LAQWRVRRGGRGRSGGSWAGQVWRSLLSCCIGRPAPLSDGEEVSAAPPAPPAAPGATACAVAKAGRGHPAGAVSAALAACAAELARQLKMLQWRPRLLQLCKAARAGGPAASHTSTFDSEKDAGEALPPQRSPSAEQRWDELLASSTSASSGVRTWHSPPWRAKACQ